MHRVGCNAGERESNVFIRNSSGKKKKTIVKSCSVIEGEKQKTCTIQKMLIPM